MALPLARTNLEAHLYMELHPCDCGEPSAQMNSSVIVTDDGELASRYTGECPRCGTSRTFEFLLPEQILPLPADGSVRYGGDEPSELIDPGEWLWVADRYARSAPAEPADLGPDERKEARIFLNYAAAALDEVLKFIPADADKVPATAFTSERGRTEHRKEPGRFRQIRLVAVRDAYRSMAETF